MNIRNTLNKVRQTFLLTLFLLALVAIVPRAKAADYAVQKTFWSYAGTWTNSPAVVTNLAAAIDVTQFTDFGLQLVASTTNDAVAGFVSVVWETSLDGSNWPTSYTNFAGAPAMQGWFAIPVTNLVKTVWNTNITMNAVGYWRIRSLTNATSGNFTNLSLTGYVKPKRTARDQ